MRRSVVVLWIAVLCVGIVSAQNNRLSVIIDTDMAADDWTALLYLLQHPAADVLAVTVTGTGETTCPTGARNAINLLTLTGDIRVPVACGSSTPLEGSHTFPQEWRDAVDRMVGLSLPRNPFSPDERGAVELLRDVLSRSAVPVTVITLGPLTNLAELLTVSPEVAGQITRIVVMGGAVDVPGNIEANVAGNPYAEWNVYVDPAALSVVLKSGVPVMLVGLDATNDVPVTPAFLRALGRDRSTSAANFVYDALQQEISLVLSERRSFWDPLTAAAALDVSLITSETRQLSVVTVDGPELGRTAVDPDGTTVTVAISADAGRFEQSLLNVLNGRAPDATLSMPAPTAPALGAELARRYYDELWSQGNDSAFSELLDPAFQVYSNSEDYAADAGGLRAMLDQLRVYLPDMQIEVRQIVVDGETAAVRFVLTGTHTGISGAIEPTGQQVAVTGQSMLTFYDGKIADDRFTFDTFALITRLGILPPEAIAEMYARMGGN